MLGDGQEDTRRVVDRQELGDDIWSSVITSKPAIHNHLKTGQRGLTQD